MYKEVYKGEYDGVAVGRVCRNQNFTTSISYYHNEYQIQYIFDGERYFFSDGNCYRMMPGTITIIDKAKIPKTNIIGGSSHDRLLIEMKESAIAPLCRLLGFDIKSFFGSHHGVYQVSDNACVQGIISGIEKLATGKRDSTTSGKIKLEVMQMFLRASEWEKSKICKFDEIGIKPHVEKQRKVHQVADYIAENYDRIDSVSSLADQFYMSKAYLCRIFREVTNFTISEYINLYRIAASKQFLMNEEMSMAEIANRLGYDSLTYFERVFKKQMTVTPLQYRKSISVKETRIK
ncbi:MAG: AraC family transcriptional regulator [Butyrivibrio sp.]|uniref:AraC family transcriptional regulator n=1 Tax=Butyrivibrio sp. TaxID=28121 RepID=UPI001B1F1645|nr:AraC family transcriptional regulator [Butyrivibrio sp.]MBO6241505.1 AraC family transcriptional regulator [Butyrivibrio sp.]